MAVSNVDTGYGGGGDGHENPGTEDKDKEKDKGSKLGFKSMKGFIKKFTRRRSSTPQSAAIGETETDLGTSESQQPNTNGTNESPEQWLFNKAQEQQQLPPQQQPQQQQRTGTANSIYINSRSSRKL